MNYSKILKSAIVCLIIVFFILISIISKPLVAGDEFINYYNTYKIFNGEIIYKDVNVISTPLLFNIGILLFKLLGPTLIVFRIYNICINVLLAIFIYKVFVNLKVEKEYSLIYMLLLEGLILKYVVGWGATYNALGLLLSLMGINLYLSKEKIKYHSFKQGVLMFFIIMTKQNIGIYYSCAYIITELILNGKKSFENILKTMAVTFICCTLYMIYLGIKGNIYDFINYTILGLKEFNNNILINAWDYICVDILIILFVLFVLCKKTYKTNDFNKIITLFVYGICMLPIGYPVGDKWHVLVGSIILMICMLYVIHNIVIIELYIENKKTNKIILLLILLILIPSIIGLTNCFGKFCVNPNNKFYMIPIDYDIKEKIELMEQYLVETNNKIIIASPEAGLYKINLNLDGDGIFDLPFLGNFGKEGENELINKLKEYRETYLLVHTNKEYWQESDKFRECIRNNYEKIGNISDFDIYYLK